MRILGYADRFSVGPGDTIRFMVSCDGHKKYDAHITRLVHGDTNPAGDGFREEEIAADVNGSYRGRLQQAYCRFPCAGAGQAAAGGADQFHGRRDDLADHAGQGPPGPGDAVGCGAEARLGAGHRRSRLGRADPRRRAVGADFRRRAEAVAAGMVLRRRQL